jgi:hypothetical protein
LGLASRRWRPRNHELTRAATPPPTRRAGANL